MSQTLSSGRRKYTSIIEALLTSSVCKIACDLADSRTIIDGVKKEKVKWNKKKKWPQGKALKIIINNDESEAKGITFRMVTDTSVNNL